MIFSRDYSRAILNLKQEETSSSDGYGIFGRVVIEIKGGRGEIMLYAKGIEAGASGNLYLICRKGDKLIPLKAVLVNINEGAAAVKWRFNPDNILGSGLKIEDVCVIVLINRDGEPILSAFCGKPVKWKREGLFFSVAVKAVSGESIKTGETEKESKEEVLKAETEALKVKEPEKEVKADIKTEIKAEKETEAKAELDERVIKFTEVVNRFQKDLDELRYYAYMEKTEREEEAAEQALDFNIDYIFAKRPVYDFREYRGDFREIGLNDLCLIDGCMYKYANNPTVRAAYRKYKHLLLGRNGAELLFCIPDKNRELKEAELLGFTDFKEIDNNFGYRIMKITKEKNSNENPKEKLDGRGA